MQTATAAESIGRHLRTNLSVAELYEIAIRDDEGLIAADGPLVVSTGTHTGEFMGIPPTGRSFDVPTFGILRFADGRAVERWGFADNMAMMQQLGLTG